VSLLTHTARVEYDISVINVKAIADAIEDVGFDAEPRVSVGQNDVSSSLSVKLEGKKTFKDLEGVLQGLSGFDRLDVVQGQLKVFYFPAIVGARDILNLFHETAIHDTSPPASPPDPSLPKRRRLLFCLPIAIAVFVLSMLPHGLSLSFATFLSLGFTTVVLYFGGWTFHTQAIVALRHCSFTMDVLVSVATNILFVYAAVSAIDSEIQDGILDKKFLHFFEAVAVLIEVLLLGRCIEERARQKTTTALRELNHARPTKATLLRTKGDEIPYAGPEPLALETGEVQIHIDLLHIGDSLRVQPGDVIPSDGIMLSDGQVFVDESLLTGEADPVLKLQSSELIGGSVIVTGACLMEVKAVGNSTVLAEIVRMVETAQLSPPNIQRIADRIAGKFVPVIFVIATLTLIVWVIAAYASDEDEVDFSFALSRSMAVLMIACPCALGLATPTAVMVATGVAARHIGCMIKSTEVFERLYCAGDIVLDKTGTITMGKPSVVATEGFSDSSLWEYVAAVEVASEHPLAKAIVAAAAQVHGVSPLEASEWRGEAGSGVEGVVKGVRVRIGNETWSYASDKLQAWAVSRQSTGCAVVFVALDGQSVGALALQDDVQPGSQAVVDYFQRLGMRVWMCTGDSEVTANAIATRVGIDPKHIYARATPRKKADVVNDLKNASKRSRSVVMVGDGINDAPSLAAADVGVAIGCGSHLTCDAADVVLVKNTIEDLMGLHGLSCATAWTIYRNFFWAFIFNSVGIPFASGAFYHALGVFIPPLFAGLAMACSSITVISSSLFLLTFRPRKVGQVSQPKDPHIEEHPVGFVIELRAW